MMKLVRLCPVLLLTMSFFAVAQEKSRILQLENLWNEAELTNDASALEMVLADDFIMTVGMEYAKQSANGGVGEGQERKYGKARRIWVMDRGIVNEENLQAIRKRGGQYLVGTPRRLTKRFEAELLQDNWTQVRPDVQVKQIAISQGEETYILCRTTGRQEKEQAIRKQFSTHSALSRSRRDVADDGSARTDGVAGLLLRLEDQIPDDHLLRLIDQHVDLSFVRERLRASTALPAVLPSNPEVRLRLLWVGDWYGILANDAC